MILIENGVKSIYHIGLLVFIIYNKQYKRALNCRSAKFFIGILSISCLYQWLFIVFQEMYEESIKEGIYHNETHTNNTVGQTILFPLGIEFRVQCFIELLAMSLFEVSSDCHETSRVGRLMHKSYSIFILCLDSIFRVLNYIYNKLFCFHKPAFKSNFEKIKSPLYFFSLFILIIISIVMASASVVIIFFDESYLTEVVVVEVSKITEIVFHLISIAYSAILIKVLRKNSKYRYYNSDQGHNIESIEMKVDFISLTISNIALILYAIIASTGIIITFIAKNGSYTTKVLGLLDVTLPAIQSILQVIIIWQLGTKLSIHKGFLHTLILINFALWLFNSFSATKNDIIVFEAKVYGSDTWEIISSVFLPLSIFFNFHSSLIIVKISSNKYKMN